MWEAVEEDYAITSILITIFTSIMSLNSAKAIWDLLRRKCRNRKGKSYAGATIYSEFELQRIKDSQKIKEYSDRYC